MKKDSAQVNSIFHALRRDHVTAELDGAGKTGGEIERHKSIRGRNGIALDVLVVVLDVLVVAALVVLAVILQG
jgi:hypothetical protein